MTYESGYLVRAFLDDEVGARLFSVQADALGKAAQQDDRTTEAPLSQFAYQFQSVHRGHSVVSDYKVKLVLLRSQQRFFSATCRNYPISQLLENRTPSQDSVAIIIDEEDQCSTS